MNGNRTFTKEERQRIIDREHMRLLGIMHYIWGSLMVIGSVILIWPYSYDFAAFLRGDLWSKRQVNIYGWNGYYEMEIIKDWSHDAAVKVYIFMWGSLIIFIIGCSIMNLISAWLLNNREMRIASKVLGYINMAIIPFGAVIGVSTVMALNKPSLIELYGNKDTNNIRKKV